MHVIVPLAGPDFVGVDGSIKAMTPFKGQPLLKFALDSRPWSSKVSRYSFVLYDSEGARRFVRDNLSHWYKGCSIVYLSSFSRGAAMSTTAGLSLLEDFYHPVIVDLADIVYKGSVDIEQVLKAGPSIGGIALTFKSDNSQYSYLAVDENGLVVEAAEKKVISGHASAGTYIFRDCATLLRAVAHAIENEASQTHNNLFYVCPLFNGVLAQGRDVTLVSVVDVIDVKVATYPGEG